MTELARLRPLLANALQNAEPAAIDGSYDSVRQMTLDEHGNPMARVPRRSPSPPRTMTRVIDESADVGVLGASSLRMPSPPRTVTKVASESADVGHLLAPLGIRGDGGWWGDDPVAG